MQQRPSSARDPSAVAPTGHRSPTAAMRSAPQRDLLLQNEVRRFPLGPQPVRV